MSHPQTKHYAYQSRLVLQSAFPRISCAAIDAVLRRSNAPRFSDRPFTAAFRLLADVAAQRTAVDGDGAGCFGAIPPHTQVFLRNKRPKKTVHVTDRRLRDEAESIPELRTPGQGDPSVEAPEEARVDCDGKAERARRQAGGRKVLAEAGTADVREALLASPPKKFAGEAASPSKPNADPMAHLPNLGLNDHPPNAAVIPPNPIGRQVGWQLQHHRIIFSIAGRRSIGGPREQRLECLNPEMARLIQKMERLLTM